MIQRKPTDLRGETFHRIGVVGANSGELLGTHMIFEISPDGYTQKGGWSVTGRKRCGTGSTKTQDRIVEDCFDLKLCRGASQLRRG